MILLVISLIVLILAGIPVGYALGISSLLYVFTMSDMSPMTVAQQVAAGADTMILLALPFFLLAGEIMNAAGITKRLTRFAMALMGPLPGGLSYVVVAANMLIAMVSGAAIASAAAIGSTMVPMMEEKGFSRGYAAAVNAASATVGPVIPPSIGFIIYASVSGASVEKLFLAGLIPGLMMAAAIMALCGFLAVRLDHPKEARQSRREVWQSAVAALPGLLMPVIILGGIFGGFVTPTEAGVLAVVYGIIVGVFVYRSLTLIQLTKVFYTSTVRSCSVLFIIANASCFGFIVSREIDPHLFVGIFQAVSEHRSVAMLLAIGMFLFLGTVMEGGSIMIIFTPMLLPVLASYEIDIVHFGVVFQMVIMIGLLTPPVGILLFVISGVGEVSVNVILRHLWPFYIVLVGTMLLTAFFPQLSLFLISP